MGPATLGGNAQSPTETVASVSLQLDWHKSQLLSLPPYPQSSHSHADADDCISHQSHAWWGTFSSRSIKTEKSFLTCMGPLQCTQLSSSASWVLADRQSPLSLTFLASPWLLTHGLQFHALNWTLESLDQAILLPRISAWGHACCCCPARFSRVGILVSTLLRCCITLNSCTDSVNLSLFIHTIGIKNKDAANR